MNWSVFWLIMLFTVGIIVLISVAVWLTENVKHEGLRATLLALWFGLAFAIMFGIGAS